MTRQRYLFLAGILLAVLSLFPQRSAARSATAAVGSAAVRPAPRSVALQTVSLPDNLFFSTVFGGRSSDEVVAIEITDSGEIFVLGKTLSRDLPATASYMADDDFTFLFVGKMKADGSGFDYLTLLPGPDGTSQPTLAVGADGAAYVAGTFEEDFPITPGALRIPSPLDRARVLKLAPNTGTLVYSANLGLIDAVGVDVDGQGAAYVVGSTAHWAFPTTPGAYRTRAFLGAGRPLVIKINPQGSGMAYATYLAPANDDQQLFSVATAVAVDAAGNAYVTGTDKNPAFPTTPGAFVARFPRGDDIFVVKLNPAGSDLVYSAVFGGESDDESTAIAVDAQGAAHIAGRSAVGFPYTGELLPGSREGFVARLAPDGSRLEYAQRIGAFAPGALAVDGEGNVFVADNTREQSLPVTADAINSACSTLEDPACPPGGVAAVVGIDPSGQALRYVTYIGSNGAARANALGINSQGELVIGGSVRDLTQFPVTNNLFGQTTSNSLAYVLKLGFGAAQPAPRPTPTPTPVPAFDLNEILARKEALIEELGNPTYAALDLPLLGAPGFDETMVATYLSTVGERQAAGTLDRQEASGVMRLTLQEEVLAAVYRSRMVAADDRHIMTYRIFGILLDIGDFAEAEFSSLGLIGDRLSEQVKEHTDSLMNAWIEETGFGDAGWLVTAAALRQRLAEEPALREAISQAAILQANHTSLAEFSSNVQPVIDRALIGAQSMEGVDTTDDEALISGVRDEVAAVAAQSAARHESIVTVREGLTDAGSILGDAGQLGGPLAVLDFVFRLTSAVSESYQVAMFNLKNVRDERKLVCDSEPLLFPQLPPSAACAPFVSDEPSISGPSRESVADRETALRDFEAALADIYTEAAAPTVSTTTMAESVDAFLEADAGLTAALQAQRNAADTQDDDAMTAAFLAYDVSVIRFYTALAARLAAPDSQEAAGQLTTARDAVLHSTGMAAALWGLEPASAARGADIALGESTAETEGDAEVPTIAVETAAAPWTDWLWLLLGGAGFFFLTVTMVTQFLNRDPWQRIGNLPQSLAPVALGLVVIGAGIGLVVRDGSGSGEAVTPAGTRTGETIAAADDDIAADRTTATPTATTSAPPSTTPTVTASPSIMPTPSATATATVTPSITPSPTRNPGPELFTYGTSVRGRPLEAVRIGTGPNAVFLIGGLHAGYAPATVAIAETALAHFSQDISRVPAGVTLYIILSANPDSINAPGELSGRLNANSVDLNRNWGCEWTADARWRNEIVPGSGGSAPFSEPETAALRDLLLENDPVAVVFWEARAANGLVAPGICGARTNVSGSMAQAYGLAAGYPVADFEALTNQVLNGDGTNWLDQQGIPAIAVLLPDYDVSDWNANLPGILAVLDAANDATP